MNDLEDPGSAARALAAVPFFATLTPVDLAKLAGVLEDRWIDAGTVVFESGGTGDSLYILRDGTAERRVEGASIGFIHPLAVFGELALLTDEPRSASIVAVTPIRVWVLPRTRFDALLRGEPELMFHLSAAIGLELAKTRRALAALRRGLEREGQKIDLEAALASAGETAALVVPPVAPETPLRRRTRLKWIVTVAIALTPFLFWTTAPPAGLSPAAWQALLSIVAAAILFASEALPEAVVALALLAVWVVGGVTAPRVALDGFATQAWVLVLAVLAVGVAVGNTGLLYRIGLIALGRKPASWFSRCLTLALVGLAVTPTLPNATSRMALAAPMVREVAEALGYEPGTRAATGRARRVTRVRTDGRTVPDGLVGRTARPWPLARRAAHAIRFSGVVHRRAAAPPRALYGCPSGHLPAVQARRERSRQRRSSRAPAGCAGTDAP